MKMIIQLLFYLDSNLFKLLVLVLITSILGCSPKLDKFDELFEFQEEILIEDLELFSLINGFSIIDNDSTSAIVVNQMDTTKLFDLKSSLLINEFIIPEDPGTPNQIIPISSDSIIRMSGYGSKLTIFDDKGLLLDEKVFASVPSKKSLGYFSATNNQVLFTDTGLFICFSRLSEFSKVIEQQKRIIKAYNWQDSEYSSEVMYPNSYINNNWGGRNMRLVYNCINETEKKIIISLPAFDSLIVYHVEQNETLSYLASSKIRDRIKPYKNAKEYNPSNYDHDKYFLDNPSYGQVIYDKYRNVYFRVFETPSKGEKGSAYRQGRKFSLIVIDPNFNIIGEALLPERYLNNMMFVIERGLVLVTSDIFNRDKTIFHVFKPVLN